MSRPRRLASWLAIPLLWLAAFGAVEWGARMLGARPRPPVLSVGRPLSLVILTLPDDERAARLAFAREHGIDVIDCHQVITPELAVPGEGHPNAAALAAPSRLPPGGAPPS